MLHSRSPSPPRGYALDHSMCGPSIKADLGARQFSRQSPPTVRTRPRQDGSRSQRHFAPRRLYVLCRRSRATRFKRLSASRVPVRHKVLGFADPCQSSRRQAAICREFWCLRCVYMFCIRIQDVIFTVDLACRDNQGRVPGIGLRRPYSVSEYVVLVLRGEAQS